MCGWECGILLGGGFEDVFGYQKEVIVAVNLQDGVKEYGAGVEAIGLRLHSILGLGDLQCSFF